VNELISVNQVSFLACICWSVNKFYSIFKNAIERIADVFCDASVNDDIVYRHNLSLMTLTLNVLLNFLRSPNLSFIWNTKARSISKTPTIVLQYAERKLQLKSKIIVFIELRLLFLLTCWKISNHILYIVIKNTNKGYK